MNNCYICKQIFKNMKILLSTDFSEENKVLLPYAIDFLKDTGGKIIIFHAYMDNVFVGSNSYPGNMDTDNYFTTELLIELEKNSQQVMQEKTKYIIDLINEEGIENITVHPILVSGDPEDELIEFSQNLIESTNVPVILGGGFNSMEHMNETLNRMKKNY